MTLKTKFAVFAAGPVGELAVKMFKGAEEQLKFVLLHKENFWKWNDNICNLLSEFPDTKIVYYENDNDLISLCQGIDAVILAYWGTLIRKNLLDTVGWGFINLHTAMLPYGKGKHAHYWSIVEGTPFGTTIMKIDEGLDTGDIIFQREIPVSWEDTSKSLYFKAIRATWDLLCEHRNEILSLDLKPIPQIGKGSFHYARELISEIDLDKKYTGRELINLLRAKSFSPFPPAYFRDGDKEYELDITIKEIDRNKDIDYQKIVNDNLDIL